MGFSKETGTFLSSDGKNEVFYSIYTPESTPKGIVQISHGMCEYCGRYEREGFVERLTDAGYVVCGNDHIGHGFSVSDNSELGFFTDYNVLADDLNIMNEIMRSKYRFLPYILFGHSMGSFVARTYISKYDNIDGCIICGTTAGNQPLGMGIALTKLLSKLHGDHYVSKLVVAMSFTGYNKRFKNEKSNFSWGTSDTEVRERYRTDPKCNYFFTVTGYREMFKMIQYISNEEWALMVPKSLPVLLISGENDPLGEYGKGVGEVYDRLENAELCELKLKLVKDGRHEPFNDFCRTEFFDTVIPWIDDVTDGVIAARTGL